MMVLECIQKKISGLEILFRIVFVLLLTPFAATDESVATDLPRINSMRLRIIFQFDYEDFNKKSAPVFKVTDVVKGLGFGDERLAAPGIVSQHHLGAWVNIFPGNLYFYSLWIL